MLSESKVYTYAFPIFDTNAQPHTCSYIIHESLNLPDRTIGVGDILYFTRPHSPPLFSPLGTPTEYGTIIRISGYIDSHVVYTFRHSSTKRLHLLYVHAASARSKVPVWQRVFEWLGTPALAHRW